MLNPDLRELLAKDDMSRYSLVIATAKRAREIAENAEKNHDIIIQKTVTIALEEILRGDYTLTESPDLEKITQD